MLKKRVVLVLVFVSILVVGWMGYKVFSDSQKNNDEARLYIDTTIPKIVKSWDFDEFYQESDKLAFDMDDMKNWFLFFKKNLGI
jgi:hypothetical protein